MAKKISKKLAEVIGNIKEIADGVTLEQLSSIFFDVTNLKSQPSSLYRLDSSGHRYYYRFDENDEPVFYTSVTTMIRNTLPTSPHLIKWLIDKGGDSGKEEASERAHYGTFLHIECAELMISGKYDLDKLQGKLQVYLLTHNIPYDRVSWTEELKKDILSFGQFIIDRNVKPLAIEICLWHPTNYYAGAIDIVCSMDFNKKRINAIVDIKSGRKGFYESHEIQLHAYLDMWKIHFPDTIIDKVFNWSPKAFRKTPTYNLKDQTDSRNAKKLPYLVELARIEDAKRDNRITVVGGMIDLVKGLDINVEELTFVELIKKNK